MKSMSVKGVRSVAAFASTLFDISSNVDLHRIPRGENKITAMVGLFRAHLAGNSDATWSPG